PADRPRDHARLARRDGSTDGLARGPLRAVPDRRRACSARAAPRSRPPRRARPARAFARIRGDTPCVRGVMRRSVRTLGAVMVAGGLLTLAWAMLVWQWEDPFTALYTKWKQHQLAQSYDRLLAQYRSPPLKRGISLAAEVRSVRRAATSYRTEMHRGQAIGRIVIGRIGLSMILVDGTDHDSLMKGPGRDLRTFMPGQNRLVYIA